MYTPLPSKIVTIDKLAQVNDYLTKVKAAMHEQDLAMQAGIGDPTLTKKLQDAHDKLVQFKRVYFPGH